MVNNILIFRTDRIGDLLYTCPALLTIKKNLNNSKITLITSKRNFEYAISLQIFHKVDVFPQDNLFSKIKFIYYLSKSKYDYIFIFDGKNRSIFASAFIDSKNKVALLPSKKRNFFFKILNIKFFEEKEDTNLNTIFQNMLNYCKIDSKIENYDFLNKKKDNNFSGNIPIKNYIHIHLDEKWFSKLYISSYKDINPTYDEFLNFIKLIVTKNNLLITTGLINFILIDKLKNHFFDKKSEKIYFQNINGNKIYLVYKPSFDDIESLLRNSTTLVSCHGAVTHAANSFDVKIIDIVDENKVKFYNKYTSYLKNYDRIYRSSFEYVKDALCKKI